MKKLSLLFLLLSFFSVISCNNDEEEPNMMEVREVAWNSIHEGEYGRASVTTNWQEAEVRTREGNYEVIFNTSHDPMLGPIVVYVNMETLEVTGQAPRF